MVSAAKKREQQYNEVVSDLYKEKPVKLTKEQKLEKVQLAQAAKKAEDDAAAEVFRKEMPALMFRLHALAEKAQVRTEVHLLNFTTEVKFFMSEFAEPEYLSADSTPWEAMQLESDLELKLEKLLAREARRALAQEAMKKLTPEELLALKEFPQYLPKY